GVVQAHRSRAGHTGERGARGVLPARAIRQPAVSGIGRAGVADRPRRSVHLPGRARRRVRLFDRRSALGRTGRPLDVQHAPLDLVLPGSERVRPLPLDPAVACGIPARPRAGAPSQVRPRATAVLLLVGVAGPYRAAAAQGVPPDVVAQRAESLRVAGRPWHAAETLLAVAAREPHLNATFVVEGAKAELHARRYDRARGLLVGQPWLDDYNNGEALGVLAEAEAKMGQAAAAAGDSTAALEALAQVGRSLDVARLALALGDSSRARDALYGLMARAPESDDGGAAVGVALASLRPRSPPERVALARAMKFHGAA